MNGRSTLEEYLDEWAAQARDSRAPVAETVKAIARTGQAISRLVSRGQLAGNLGATRAHNGSGDAQKELDVLANDLLVEGLKGAPVASVASEEMDEPLVLDPNAPFQTT